MSAAPKQCLCTGCCRCTAPFPRHLAKHADDRFTHVCRCGRAYKVKDGQFVYVGDQPNPIAQADADADADALARSLRLRTLGNEEPDRFARAVGTILQDGNDHQVRYLHSRDPKEPRSRLIVDVGESCVDVLLADMTSSSARAHVVEVHDRIVMTRADARWLRDTLCELDLGSEEDDS